MVKGHREDDKSFATWSTAQADADRSNFLRDYVRSLAAQDVGDLGDLVAATQRK